MSGVELDLRGEAGVQKMLEELQGQPLQNRTRKALRAGAAIMRKELRARASGSRFPKTFRRTRTRSHRNPVGVSVSPGSPLSTIFEHGARAHAIPIKRGPFEGRTIQHPGMAARPLSGPAFDAKCDEAERAIADALVGGL